MPDYDENTKYLIEGLKNILIHNCLCSVYLFTFKFLRFIAFSVVWLL